MHQPPIPSPPPGDEELEAMGEQAQTVTEATPPNTSFLKPTKTTNIIRLLRRRAEAQQYSTTTSNRFDPLNNDPDQQDHQSHGAKTQYTRNSSLSKNTHKQKPPPIIIQGKPENQNEIRKELGQHFLKGFTIKYSRFNMHVQANDVNEHKAYLKALKDAEADFHTYTLAAEKTHAFVLRGLDADLDISDIQADLEENHQITPHKIYKLKTNYRPLYMVVTDATITLKQLNSNIKFVLNTRITWERRRNERKIIQCHRCQSWGHATANCNRPFRCLKCSASHPTYTCEKPRSEPAKCANCNGDHPANSIECPIYKQRLDQLEQKKSTEKTRFVPAPTPSNNPWIRRQEKDNEPEETHNQAKTKNANNSTVNQFNNIVSELQTLSAKINLGGVLAMVRDLNKIIKLEMSKHEKAFAMLEFCINNVDQYEI